MRGDVPEEVLRFIERRIDSVPHLETLLLLWENPTTSWCDNDVAARVYISREQARTVAADLLNHGLIRATEPAADHCYAFNGAWDETQLMSKVAAAYRSNLVLIANFIHQKSASDAVRDFARAFNFRNEE